jgi:hypothetical protein
MVAHFEPLGGFYDHRLLSKFHIHPNFLQAANIKKPNPVIWAIAG